MVFEPNIIMQCVINYNYTHTKLGACILAVKFDKTRWYCQKYWRNSAFSRFRHQTIYICRPLQVVVRLLGPLVMLCVLPNVSSTAGAPTRWCCVSYPPCPTPASSTSSTSSTSSSRPTAGNTRSTLSRSALILYYNIDVCRWRVCV